MIGALLRVVAGFVLACLLAGLIFVLFAMPPTELASDKGPGLTSVADWALKSGTQAAIFAAPFALIAAAIGEWQRLRGPGFYILAGMLIAATGFLAQHSSETAGQHTVLNEYAIKAFLTSGFFAGLLYWLIAGRVAGEGDPEPATARSAASPAAPAKSNEPAAKPAASAATKSVPDVKPADVKPVAEAKAAAAKLADVADKAAEKAGDAAKAALDEARRAVKDPESKT